MLAAKSKFKRNFLIMMYCLIISSLIFAAGCSGKGTDKKGDSTYPKQQITIVVPMAAGGSTDLAARAVSSKLGEILGVPVVVVNKTGGGGGIGATEVAQAKPDGYTLLATFPAANSIVPYITNVPYDYNNFTPIARLTNDPLALTVKKDSPFKTLKDFVDYAKAHPGEIKYGTSGVGSNHQLNMERLAAEYIKDPNFKVTHVPFSGANPAVTALLGGHVNAVASVLTDVAPYAKTGELRILAVYGDKRSEQFPDVPTLKEQGYDMTAYTWYGLAGPKGLSQDILDKLDKAIQKCYEDKTVLENFKNANATPAYLGPKGFGEIMMNEALKYKELIEKIGLAKKNK